MLLGSYRGVTEVLHVYYLGLTGVLCSFTEVLEGVTEVLQVSYVGLAGVLHRSDLKPRFR